MRATGVCIVAIALFLASGNLQGGGKDPGQAVLKKIQGTWKFIAQTMDGKSKSAEELANTNITFKDNKWTVRVDGKVVQAGTHKFDPTKKPGHVDAVVTQGEDKDNTMLGIYELKGDKLKVCFDPKGKERPKSFTAKGGQFSAVVEREKKKP
jgi:uncharacterized protein (TIGR03067 family)